MKKVVIINDKKSFNDRLVKSIRNNLENIWLRLGCEIHKCEIEDDTRIEYFYKWIEGLDPDYICTIDMSGFSIPTFTDNLYYNILYAKQIHVVTHKKIWEYYADEVFALNLYMILQGETVALQKKYPEIPNILGYTKLDASEQDKDVLWNIVKYVIEDVGDMELQKNSDELKGEFLILQKNNVQMN